ncbi:hypothetical protein HPB49_022829 [Dermacentor silvarum]|uniref:Uncharacterized protein n=1 Tax=Dermacentor silvarum TaxID=543639 RepID=A0ACB8CN70_DERSI|nr:hypothetical protein HPB49_022829 [Dermacentor silvarum]
MAENAYCFLEAKDLSSLANDKLYKDIAAEICRQTESAKRPPRDDTECFLCNKTGHRASECWSRTRNNQSTTGSSSGKIGSSGETGKTQEKQQASFVLSTVEASETGIPGKEYVVLQSGETIPVMNMTFTSRWSLAGLCGSSGGPSPDVSDPGPVKPGFAPVRCPWRPCYLADPAVLGLRPGSLAFLRRAVLRRPAPSCPVEPGLRPGSD